MNLQQFIAAPIAKYAVISALAYYNFPVATNLATSPRMFSTDSMAYVVISLKDSELPMLVGYIRTIGFDIEFGFTEGTGKVSLLTVEQVVELLDTYAPEVE
jgi:hypothetical protein